LERERPRGLEESGPGLSGSEGDGVKEERQKREEEEEEEEEDIQPYAWNSAMTSLPDAISLQTNAFGTSGAHV
jgi:hypothetical protein